MLAHAGSMLLADRGYDADWIRELIMKSGAYRQTIAVDHRMNFARQAVA
jgi:hypothetical protein